MQWSSFFNIWWELQNSFCWQCMVYYNHMWNLSNGNTRPLYVNMGQVIMHGRRGAARYSVSRGRSTWCLAQFLPSTWQTFVGFISPQHFHWFDNLIGFDNSCCIWKPLVNRGAILYPLRPRADVQAKVDSYPGVADATSQRPLNLFTRRIQILCYYLCRSVV